MKPIASLALLLAACAPRADAAETDVHLPIAFTSAAMDDTLTIAVLDLASDDGVALLIVRNAQGWPVYADAVSLAALAWEEPSEPWTPELAGIRLGLTYEPLARFEADLVPRAEAGVGAFWPVTESDALARARAADRPLLCSGNAPGGYTCAWYDDRSGRGVALIEGAS